MTSPADLTYNPVRIKLDLRLMYISFGKTKIIWIVSAVLLLLAAGIIFLKLRKPLIQQLAQSNYPNYNKSYFETFKTGSINPDVWTLKPASTAAIVKPNSNNLGMSVASGMVDSSRLIFNKVFEKGTDFKVTVVIDRPKITGNGYGQSGIALSSSEGEEAASIMWRIESENEGTVVFNVNDSTGKNLIHKDADLGGSKAVS